MDPDSKPNENISLPRNIRIDGIINSKIINLNIVSIISRWIDKVDANRNFSHIRELYLAYKFHLLLRGSRDGFTPKKFHELCDGKSNTVTFIKVKGTEEIIGEYNPLKWEPSRAFGVTNDSFIFSFKNKNYYEDAVISNVKNMNHALWFHTKAGPHFSGDISIYSSNESVDYEKIYCRKLGMKNR